MNSALAGVSRLYLDTNTIIYLVERNDELYVKIRDLIAAAMRGGVQIFFSDIGVAECFYGAAMIGEPHISAAYRNLFYAVGLLNLVPLTSERAIEAAHQSGRLRLKLIDSIHWQAALEMGCDLFVTNDLRFRSSDVLRVLHLRDL